MRHQRHFLRILSRLTIHISQNHSQMPRWHKPELATRFIKAEPTILTVPGLLPAKKCNSLSWTQTRWSEAEEQKALNVYSWFIYIHLYWHQLNKQLQMFIAVFDSDCRFFLFFLPLNSGGKKTLMACCSAVLAQPFNPKVPLPPPYLVPSIHPTERSSATS